MKQTKKEIYAENGIIYDNKANKIYHHVLGWINPLLVNGNQKIGKGVYHFSTLPTNQLFDVVINGISFTLKGTCKCNCNGCYATKGNYNFPSVKNALGVKTWLVRNDLQFIYNAITAQIKAENIKTVRIHASGDFDRLAYLFIWVRVIKENPSVIFWTYTKVKQFENAFEQFENANIVKSLIDGIGVNYGHCGYIKSAYEKLNSEGKKVHICKCGIDDNQHCVNCTACSKNDYVLFIEHSTEYNAKADSNYEPLKAIIENQKTS